MWQDKSGVSEEMITRKKGKDDRSRIIRALDTVTPKIVKLRDNYQCQRCGSVAAKARGLHSAHIYGRRDFRLRWDLLNLITLCCGCHVGWGHGNPIAFQEWFKGKWPHRMYYLAAKRREPVRPVRTPELADILESRRRKLKELEQERKGGG